MAVTICDACCTWSSSDKKEFDLLLHKITLQVPKGCLVAVVGEVESLAAHYLFFSPIPSTLHVILFSGMR